MGSISHLRGWSSIPTRKFTAHNDTQLETINSNPKARMPSVLGDDIDVQIPLTVRIRLYRHYCRRSVQIIRLDELPS